VQKKRVREESSIGTVVLAFVTIKEFLFNDSAFQLSILLNRKSNKYINKGSAESSKARLVQYRLKPSGTQLDSTILRHSNPQHPVVL